MFMIRGNLKPDNNNMHYVQRFFVIVRIIDNSVIQTIGSLHLKDPLSERSPCNKRADDIVCLAKHGCFIVSFIVYR